MKHDEEEHPPVSRKCGDVLPDESGDDALIVQDLERENGVAGLAGRVVELEVVLPHPEEAEVVVPGGIHVGLRLCQGDADQVVCASTLDQKTISCPRGVPVARAPETSFMSSLPEVH